MRKSKRKRRRRRRRENYGSIRRRIFNERREGC